MKSILQKKDQGSRFKDQGKTTKSSIKVKARSKSLFLVLGRFAPCSLLLAP